MHTHTHKHAHVRSHSYEEVTRKQQPLCPPHNPLWHHRLPWTMNNRGIPYVKLDHQLWAQGSWVGSGVP